MDTGLVNRDITDYFTSKATPINIVLSHEEINDMEDNNINVDCTRTDLDTHASMIVLANNLHATNCTDRTAEVQPLSLE